MTGTTISIFVFGILTGWLVEWLFITFIMPKPKNITTTSNTQTKVIPLANTKKSMTTSPPAEKTKENMSIKSDDLMKLKGIGPKLAESLKTIKINRYKELADFTGDELIAKLERTGAIIVNRPMFTHIPKQAALAEKGDWDALDSLKKSI